MMTTDTDTAPEVLPPLSGLSLRVNQISYAALIALGCAAIAAFAWFFPWLVGAVVIFMAAVFVSSRLLEKGMRSTAGIVMLLALAGGLYLMNLMSPIS